MNTEQDEVDVRGVVSYVLLAYVPAWLLTLPMWFTGEGLSWVWSPVVLVAMMFMPALATFIVTRWISPMPNVLRTTGVRSPRGFRGWWRYALLGWFGPPVTMVVALAVAALLGVYHADWTGFSGLTGQAGPQLVPGDQPSGATLGLLQITQILLLGWLNVLPAAGEEWGWRGYLTQALLPLGQPGAFLVTGVLWGLWHAPLLMLGYNYPDVPIVVALFMMVCFCTLTGVLLGWLRLTTRSVWPSAIAHGFINASAGLALVFSAAGSPVSSAHVGLLGWSGWLVLTVLILLLALFNRLPVKLTSESAGLSRGLRRLSRR